MLIGYRRRGRSAVGLVAVVSVIGCVEYPSPALSDAVQTSDSSALPDEGQTQGSSTTGPFATGSDTGGGLEASDFAVYWAVRNPELPPLAVDPSTQLRTDVYLLDLTQGWGLSSPTPGLGDMTERLDLFEADIRAQIPEFDATGLAVIEAAGWPLSWCSTFEVHRDEWTLELGPELTDEEYADRWHTAAAAVRIAMLERAKALRPLLQWSVAGVPNEAFHQHVSLPGLADWRQCVMASPQLRPVYALMDVVTVRARFYYSDRPGMTPTYIGELVDTANLSLKPVYLLLEGRYNYSEDALNGEPLLAEDVAGFLRQSRWRGAAGFIYALDVNGSWPDGAVGTDALPPYWAATFEAELVGLR